MNRVSFQELENYHRSLSEIDPKIFERVSAILQTVKQDKDAALIRYTRQFDKVQDLNFDIKVSPKEFKEAVVWTKANQAELLNIFLEAAENIRHYHSKQKESSWFFNPEDHITLGQSIHPVPSAGVYVPGGKAFYPSSLLMNVIPAQVAGVPNIAIATPPNAEGKVHPLLLTLADALGVADVYKMGGAQAIAAFAYGTETVPAVAKITGPGNIYVAAAKRLVLGTVGIDSIAGPSEVVVLADQGARSDWVAMDLCAQAEHDEETTVILISTSEGLLNAVDESLEKIIPTLPRKEIIQTSLKNHSLSVHTPSLENAFDLVNRIAPEHIEVMLAMDNQEILSRIWNAGAIFLGDYTPVAMGDYFVGSNHVLPTNGTAVFSSPLGVYDFIKKSSFAAVGPAYLKKHGSKIVRMAEYESLQAHANSVKIRL